MATPDAAPTTIWLTDRSRSKLGLGRCLRARYLANHFGPSGYGISAAAQALPLATGKYVHVGIERWAKHLLATDTLPPIDLVRSTILDVQQQYEASVAERGFRGILAGVHTDETIKEQKVLISGLLWALRLTFLPWFHDRYRVVEAEEERLHFLDCTCGANLIDWREHIRRGCEGHALMIRSDLLAENRVSGGSLAYFEFKTSGWAGSTWIEQWETDPQLALGTLDIREKYGKEVTELYIVVMDKGARKRDEDDPEGRRKQRTPLCEGYCRPGNPPLMKDDWLPAYRYVTPEGDTKQVSRAHRKRGVWELAESDWPLWEMHRRNDPDMTPEECWVRLLPQSVLEKVCFTIGPMNRQDRQLEAVRRGMLADEERWQQVLWDLYTAASRADGGAVAWDSESFQATLDRLVPRSWQCRPFGKEAQCEFVPICHGYAEGVDPIGSGRYKVRRPHHGPERDQAIARGLLEADTVEGEDE